MRRDLDLNRNAIHEQREREFGDTEVQIGGEIFRLRVNAPYGVWMALDEATQTEGFNVFRKTEEAILLLIEPDEEGGYDRLKTALRSEFTHDDLLDLVRSLTEETTGRPTEAPNSSPDGREKTGTSSTDTSSSPPAEAQAS